MINHRAYACLLAGATAFAASSAFAAETCVFNPPLATQTKCVTAIAIPGNPLRSFDISFVNQDRGEYYFSDRSNSGVQVIGTHDLKWKRTLGGFVGVALTPAGAVDNNHSGPDGVTAHGRWVYAGDGNSTLKVFDLQASPLAALKQSIATGGTTRVDEMALTSDGRLLLAANNAEDPPFGTLFAANGDDDQSHVKILTKITVDPAIVPAGFGLSFEQPSWDPRTQRFYNSMPIIANNPAGCNFNPAAGPITCDGGLLVIDPARLSSPNVVLGAFDPHTNTGVIALKKCGPNGSTVGPHDNLLLGCTPQNNPSDVISLIINATSKQQTPVAHITGSDEVWYNAGDNRYYAAANRDCTVPGTPCPAATQQTPVLGVIDAETNTIIEKVPQSANSHSVAADADKNFIFVPQVAPVAVVGAGGDTTNVGAGICGTNNGCVAVYRHKVRDDDDDHDHDHEARNDH
jgi:hypothetical protein